MPALTACAPRSGRLTSVSSASTARRWTSKGLNPAPKSRATSARRGAIQQREHLVVLAPQLAEPLHRQRLRHDDQAALDVLGVEQPIHDQRRFDRLAQPDLVGQQPSHRHPCGRAFGDMQLVREQPHTAAEKRAKAAGFTRRQEAQDVEPREDVRGVVDLACGQPFEQRAVAARCPIELRLGFRNQRIAVGGKPQRRPTVREMDDQHAPFDGGDATGAEFGVEAVGQVVPDGPGGHRVILPRKDGGDEDGGGRGGRRNEDGGEEEGGGRRVRGNFLTGCRFFPPVMAERPFCLFFMRDGAFRGGHHFRTSEWQM